MYMSSKTGLNCFLTERVSQFCAIPDGEAAMQLRGLWIIRI